jgi:hypothetical protein
MKIGKPTGSDGELTMPADEFDSIMGKVLGASGGQEKRGGKLNDRLNDQKKHPGQLPTKGGRQYTDVKVTETPGAPPPNPPKK